MPLDDLAPGEGPWVRDAEHQRERDQEQDEWERDPDHPLYVRHSRPVPELDDDRELDLDDEELFHGEG